MPIQTGLVHLNDQDRVTKIPPRVPMPKRPNVLLLPALLLVAALSIAQQTSQPQSSRQSGDQNPAETLKVNVNVVQLFFNVKDKHGALIPNLAKTDFDIFEDGKPQTIKYFTAETNLPLTIGMMID